MDTDPYQSIWYFLGAFAFLLVLGIGLFWMVMLKRQLKQPEDEAFGNSLADFEQLYAEGELSLEEIEHIRKRFSAPTLPESADTGVREVPQAPQRPPLDEDSGTGEFTSDPPKG